jgi:tRNA threonylcarbamoyladenosine biosynthesis protein TsaB
VGGGSKILALDTATNSCSVAYWSDGVCVASRFEVMARGQSEALAPMAAAVMRDAAGAGGFETLDGVAVTVGPGTFTGVRIGLAAAKALALPRRLPVVALTTFDALRCGIDQGDNPLLIAIETKRADFYVQLFAPGGKPVSAPAALDAEDIAPLLLGGPVALGGDGARRLLAALPGEASRFRRLSMPDCPNAAVFGACAAERLDGGVLGAAEPLYLRPPSVTLRPAG